MRTALPELAAELHTTDRTLRRALDEGLVNARRPTPRTLDLPVSERAYLRRTWPVLARLREALRTEPSVSLAVLFGSRARGDDTATSDIDILVQLRGPKNVRRLASRLSAKVGSHVQLVTLEDAWAAPLLLREVIRDGRVLVDREGEWQRVRHRRTQVERAARQAERDVDTRFAALFGGERVA